MPMLVKWKALWIIFLFFGLAGCSSEAPPHASLLFKNAQIFDGEGAVGFQGDLALVDGEIAAIGDLKRWTADQIVEVQGRALTPGFIDMHSHADLILLTEPEVRDKLLEQKIRQGITTIVVGNCGLGTAPSNSSAAEILAKVNHWMTPEQIEPTPLRFDEYLSAIESSPPPLNIASLIPHGPLRISQIGLQSGEPSSDAVQNMQTELREAFHAGGFGLSFGLIYPPGMFSNSDELLALAEVVKEFDGLVTVHIRGSSELLIEATEELISIGATTGVRTHHSHLEAVGEPFWAEIQQVLALEDAARKNGVDLSHDMFPYSKAATMMVAVFPPSALEGGVPRLLERLDQQELREAIGEQIQTQIPEWPPWLPGGWPHNLVHAVGWDGIRVASVDQDDSHPWLGRSLQSLADELDTAPYPLLVDLMLEHDGSIGQWVDEISGFDSISPDPNLLAIMNHPAAAIVTDAEDYGGGSPHPAHAGAMARALRWNRESQSLPWGVFIQKMTSLPAHRVGFKMRGRLKVGYPADLVILDLESVRDHATWDEPRLPSTGVDWVLIDGKPVVKEGLFLGGNHGQVLRKPLAEAQP